MLQIQQQILLKNHMKLFIIFITLASTIFGKLYQVVSLARHGARYHTNDWGDGNQTRPLWGQLTAVGMRQQQRLGELLRKEYIDNLGFLNSNYNRSEIEVYSTPVNRTILSVQSLLYGLYPAGTGPRMSYVDRIWHIPPYSNKTDHEEQNYAFPNKYQPIKVKQSQKIMVSGCPNYEKFVNQNLQRYTEVVSEMNMTYHPFFKRLSTMFNFSLPTNFLTMFRVWDMINVDKYLGRPLPKDLTAQDQSNVLHLANWYFAMTEQGNASLIFTTGKLQRLFTVFDNRVRLPDTYPLKWTLLSGHDSDIFTMQIALNLTSYDCIEQQYRKGSTTSLNCETGGNFFASNIIFELHSDNGKDFYVKVKSNGKYMNLCGKKSTQCDYLQFKGAYKKNIASNFDQLCGKKITQLQSQPQQKQHLSILQQ